MKIARKGVSALVAALLVTLACAGIERAPAALASPLLFNYSDFSSTAGLQLNGSATTAFPCECPMALRLTPAVQDQAGSAFYTTPVSTTSSFHTQFQFYFHDSTTTAYYQLGPADGMTFVLQSDPRATTALGDGGGSLGYGDNDPAAIKPSIAVAFNTYFADGKPPLSILTNGDAYTYPASDDPGFSFYSSDTSTRYAWIDYDASSHLLQVYVNTTNTKPDTPAISYTYNIAANLGSGAIIGFTGGTGEGDMDEDVLNWQFSGQTGYAFPTGGAFVLGDAAVENGLSASSPPTLTFWSPVWSRLNLLKSEPRTYGPAAFKGFATSLSRHPPACGGTWTVPAAYSAAPPSTLPHYMAVLVSSQIAQSKATISGNITRIVIVQPSPGYNYRNGRAATGIVLSTLCSP
jgi:hypothetical protein